jgi:hypothetical protein
VGIFPFFCTLILFGIVYFLTASASDETLREDASKPNKAVPTLSWSDKPAADVLDSGGD